MSYKKSHEAIALLSPEEYWVTQENGTERPGTGKLLYNKEPGIYVDIVSGEPLFLSPKPVSQEPPKSLAVAKPKAAEIEVDE